MTFDLTAFERQLLDGHTCAKTHSKAIAFARGVKVPDMTIANLLAAAVLRSNVEVDAFDEIERTGKPPQPIGWVRPNGCGEIVFRQAGHPKNDEAINAAAPWAGMWRAVYLKDEPS